MSKETKSNENPKEYHPAMDIASLGRDFTKIFHQHVLAPEYYLNALGRNNQVWDNIPTEEPVKNVKEFLPHCRYPPRMKWNFFNKAERVGQHLVVSEILSHYLFTNFDQIHYRGDPIEKINLQWLTVTGHRNPFMEEEEQWLLNNKQPISIIHLVTKSGQNLYLDLCASQVDIYHYSGKDGKRGHPFLLLHELKLNKLYAPKHNRNIKVIAIEEPVSIESEENFGTYLEMLVDEDDGELLIEYHERIEADFRKLINQKMGLEDSSDEQSDDESN